MTNETTPTHKIYFQKTRRTEFVEYPNMVGFLSLYDAIDFAKRLYEVVFHVEVRNTITGKTEYFI